MNIHNSKPSTIAEVLGIPVGSSVLIGLSFALIVFVLFFQTPVLSGSRLVMGCLSAVVLAAANYFFVRYYLSARLMRAFAGKAYTLSLCFILPLLFLPLFYKAPAYPVTPLLQPWTDLTVEFDLSSKSQAVSFSKSDIHLNLNGNPLDAGAFTSVGVWRSVKNMFSLDPGSSAALHWTDPATESMTLTIQSPPALGTLTVYWDQSRTTYELSPASAGQIVLTRKFTIPLAVNILLFLAYYFLSAWILLLLLTLLGERSRSSGLIRRVIDSRFLLLLLVLVFSVVTVKLQLDSLHGGTNFLYDGQLREHNNVLTGQAPNPWQYRVLSEILVEGLIDLCRLLGIPDSIGFGFVAFRLLQNVVLFLLAYALYRQLSTSKLLPLIGIALLAITIKNGFYDNDLSFNTYFDVIFYLAAVLLILRRQYFWVALLMIPAALNRETSGVIPFLMLAAILDNLKFTQKKYLPVYLAMAVFVITIVGLRLLFPNRPLYIPYKQTPGYQLLLYNLTRTFTWGQLFHTLGFAPLLSLAFFFVLPGLWQRFFLVLVPIWFGIHSFLSVMGETRLYFVPQAIIFIPAALFVFEYFRNPEVSQTQPQLKGVP